MVAELLVITLCVPCVYSVHAGGRFSEIQLQIITGNVITYTATGWSCWTYNLVDILSIIVQVYHTMLYCIPLCYCYGSMYFPCKGDTFIY